MQRKRRLFLTIGITVYFLLAVLVPSNDHQRAIVLVAGIPIYAACSGLCFLGWRSFKDILFLWQGLHLLGLLSSAVFFSLWYWHGRPPLPAYIEYIVPNLINFIMLVPAALWVEQAFHKKD